MLNKSSSGEIEIAQFLYFLLNFSLAHRFKFLQEDNFFCYVSSLEHRFFNLSITPPISNNKHN